MSIEQAAVAAGIVMAPIVDATVVDILTQACMHYCDKPAFTCMHRTLSYAEVDQLSQAFASYIQHYTDLEPGDRIAILMPNLLQYPIVMLGAMRAGLVVVNTNPLYTEREIEHQLSDSGAKAVVVIAGIDDKVQMVANKTAIEIIIVTDFYDLHTPLAQLLHKEEGRSCSIDGVACNDNPVNKIQLKQVLAAGALKTYNPVIIGPEALAVLQYTGGTTGVARGAMLSHRNLVANMSQYVEHTKDYFREGEEIYVAPLPLYHIYAFSIHCIGLPHKGGHSILIPNPRDISALVAAIKPFKFTGFVGINTLFNALCADKGFIELHFSHLRSTASGGMALTADTAKNWLKVTGIEIAEGYGMTETSPVIASNPRENMQLGTVGLPVPGTQVKVIDQAGKLLPVGERGELCVRGPQVMQGYWQQPDKTAEVLSADGWLRTGDVVLIQADGYIRIVDRIKEMIIVSGFNVYPTEIESIASLYPGVKECAAVSVPDNVTGEAVKLFVVPTADVFDSQDLREFMRSQMAAYKVPASIVFIAELPKSSVGKVLRRELLR